MKLLVNKSGSVWRIREDVGPGWIEWAGAFASFRGALAEVANVLSAMRTGSEKEFEIRIEIKP